MAVMLFTPLHFLSAQNREVSGIVLNDTREPLSGVSVHLKGTAIGTVTDENGAYILPVRDHGFLVFRHIAFRKQNVRIGVKNTINIVLMPDKSLLSNVTVANYRFSKSPSLPSWSVAASANEITDLSLSDPQKILLNRFGSASPMIHSADEYHDALTQLSILNSFGVSNTPLIVIDGVIDPSRNLASQNTDHIFLFQDTYSDTIYGGQKYRNVILISERKTKHPSPENCHTGSNDI